MITQVRDNVVRGEWSQGCDVIVMIGHGVLSTEGGEMSEGWKTVKISGISAL